MSVSAKPKPVLDADELLHLAVLDSQAGRHDVAIAKLKIAAEQAPENGKIHYMLAAEHAEIGLFDRAIEGMARAITLDPSLDTARLQLGLLHYTQGRVDQARGAWEGLDKLAPDDALFLFKSALLRLSAGETAETVELLDRAARNVKGNRALGHDIQRVLSNVRARAGTPEAPKANTSHLLATKYGESAKE